MARGAASQRPFFCGPSQPSRIVTELPDYRTTGPARQRLHPFDVAGIERRRRLGDVAVRIRARFIPAPELRERDDQVVERVELRWFEGDGALPRLHGFGLAARVRQ